MLEAISPSISAILCQAVGSGLTCPSKILNIRGSTTRSRRDGSLDVENILRATVAPKGMEMRSWRLRRMVTVWLGVFALLLQQYLSFGHIHIPDRIASRTLVTELAVGKSLAAGEQRTPSGLPDDNCPICAAMVQLSAAGLLPAPPLVAGPAEFSQLTHHVFIERFSFDVPRHLLFHTRAPPLA